MKTVTLDVRAPADSTEQADQAEQAGSQAGSGLYLLPDWAGG